MNLALLNLIRLQFRGFLRRMGRGVKTPRRAIFMLIGIAAIILWVVPPVVSDIVAHHVHAEQARAAPQRFRDMAPLALLGICVMTIVSSAGDRAIAFTAGEVDFLFPGPCTRRELLAYKLLKSFLGTVLSALFLSLALFAYSVWWPASYIGIILTRMIIELFSPAGVLLGQTIGQ